MVRQLRKLHGKPEPSQGLILANGGVLTTESAMCFSTHLRRSHTPYPLEDKPPVHSTHDHVPPMAFDREGEAVVEVCTETPKYFRLLLN